MVAAVAANVPGRAQRRGTNVSGQGSDGHWRAVWRRWFLQEAAMATTIRRILVPTDFSAPSEEALRYAADLAARLSASVVVVHVIHEPFIAGGEWDLYVRDAPEMRQRLFSDASSRLSAVAETFERRGVHVTTDVRFGPPRDGIINAAEAAGADLIVMSTHGRSGLHHLLLGSVAEHVIRAAHCPVLAVREAARSPATGLKTTTAA